MPNLSSSIRRLAGYAWVVVVAVVPTVHAQAFTTIINVPPDTLPEVIGSDTQVNISSGEFTGALMHVGDFYGSTSNVEFNITGGDFWRTLSVSPNSTANISGNAHMGYIYARPDSTVNITGGHIIGKLVTDEDSQANLFGGEFRVNGVPVAGLDVLGDSVGHNLASDTVLTGTLSDGSVFFMPASTSVLTRIEDGTLTLTSAAVPAVNTVINMPGTPPPEGLRPGQTLNLGTGGYINDWLYASSATLNIQGGTIANSVKVADTDIVMAGGLIGDDLDVYVGSSLAMSEGTVDGQVRLQSGSSMTMDGGTIRSLDVSSGSHAAINSGYIGEEVYLSSGSNLAMHGGQVDSFFAVSDESKLELFGGTLGQLTVFWDAVAHVSGGTFTSLSARGGSQVVLHGHAASLDGVDLTEGMVDGDALVISQRDALLEVELLDGTHYSSTLFDGTNNASDYVSADATFMFMLHRLPGDLNGDGFVGITDLNLILSAWNTNVVPGDLLSGDPSGDGFVGIEDLNLVLGNWNTGTPPTEVVTPEPASAAIVLFGVMAGALRRKRA